jgi:hypothetical protein
MSIGLSLGTYIGRVLAGVAGGGSGVTVGIGNRISGVGASQVANVGVPPVMETDGFMFWVWNAVNNKGQFAYHPQVALGGETLAETLARVQDATNGFPAHTANYGCLPAFAIIQAGRNNMNETLATDVVDHLVTYESILDYLLGIGILPIITACLVSDNAASLAIHQRNLGIYNMGLALMARKKGLPFIDPNPSLVDTATGGISAANALDALHVNDVGAKVMGEYIVSKLLATGFAAPWDVPLAVSNDANTDDAYLLGNMLMLNDTAGQPTGWTQGGADTANLTTSVASAAADSLLGDYMVMTKAATAGDAQNQSSTMTVIPGNWVAIGWADKYVHTSGTPSVTMRARTSPANTDLVLKTYKTTSTQNQSVSKNFHIVKIPASQTGLFLRATMNSIGVYSVAQVTCMDLTAYGLDTWLS